MFFMLARNITSKASPSTGIAPTVVSSSVLAIMRAISPLGSAQLARFPDEIARNDARDDVAGNRHQTDDDIEAQPDVGAGQDEGAIHQTRQSFQAATDCPVSPAE